MATRFEREHHLCAAFIEALPEAWTAYPETAGFDILLVHRDGYQVGVEAKLRLNAKVVEQSLPSWHADYGYREESGPDFRAVLVPKGCVGGLSAVCSALGITVISCSHPSERSGYGIRDEFRPRLPEQNPKWNWDDKHWHDWCPLKRCRVPEYVPDVVAGASAPATLSVWKVGAIKLTVLLERRGYLTREDFKRFDVSMSRWTAPWSGWLSKGGARGRWIKGPALPDFRTQHPVNFAEIEADFPKWNPDDLANLKGTAS